MGDLLVSDRGDGAGGVGRRSRVDLLWDSGSEATLWRDGEVLQGLYSGWRALRTVAPVLEPATGGEPVELAVEMACNSWAGDDPDPAPGVDPGLAARYRLGRNWSEGEAPPRAPAGWARLEQCALARFDPERLAAALGPRDPAPTGGGGRARPRCGLGGHPARRAESVLQRWEAGERETWEPAGAILAELLARRGPAPAPPRVRGRPRARRHGLGVADRRDPPQARPHRCEPARADRPLSGLSLRRLLGAALRMARGGRSGALLAGARGASPQGAGRSSAAHGSSRTATSPTASR